MTDDELVYGFERTTLAPALFGHRDHVRLAWLYLTRHGRAETERRLLTGLRRFAVRAGRPGKFDAPLTLAWIDAIDGRRKAGPGTEGFEEFAERHRELFDRAWRPAQAVSGPVT